MYEERSCSVYDSRHGEPQPVVPTVTKERVAHRFGSYFPPFGHTNSVGVKGFSRVTSFVHDGLAINGTVHVGHQNATFVVIFVPRLADALPIRKLWCQQGPNKQDWGVDVGVQWDTNTGFFEALAA